MNSAGCDILVGTLAKEVFVRVEGKGTHANSQPLREFLLGMLEQGCRTFHLDLQNCTYMDSTFLGTIVGVCLQVKGKEGSRFIVANASQRNRELFQTLGVAQFFEFASMAAPAAPAPQQLETLPHGQDTKQQRAETMLEAHETLTRVDAANVPRFKDCIEFLKEDLARMKADSADANGK